jgi:hypothetical protein
MDSSLWPMKPGAMRRSFRSGDPNMERSSAELETLAVFVHGLTAFGHLLGVVYNYRRAGRVDRDVTIHGAALIYDIYSAAKHAKRLRATKGEMKW